MSGEGGVVVYAGAYYLDRAGRRVGPVRPNGQDGSGGCYPWRAEGVGTYNRRGFKFATETPTPDDLVREVDADGAPVGRDKPVDALSLADYRRGVARVMGGS